MAVLTVDIMRETLPQSLHRSVDQKLVDEIIALQDDPGLKEVFIDNLLSHTAVLHNKRYSLAKYLCAVQFVSHKMVGLTNIKAHKCTFPEKHVEWARTGVTTKDVSSYVSAYNTGKLVKEVERVGAVQFHILHADKAHRAITVQVELMEDETISPKVRSDAANSVLTHTKAPDLEVLRNKSTATSEEASGLDMLEAIQKQLAEAQLSQIIQVSVSAVTVAAQPIGI